MGGRDEDLSQEVREAGVSVDMLSWDSSDTPLASPLPLSQHLLGPWPKCSLTREYISDKCVEIFRIDGPELEVLIS